MWERIEARGRTAASLMWASIQEYTRHKGSRMAAALAFYSVFSLAPMLIVAVAIVGAVFGDRAARGEIFRELRLLVGDQLAQFVQNMVEQASYEGSGLLATVVGVGTLLYGSSKIFNAIRDGLDLIWGVELHKNESIWETVKDYALSLALVPGFGVLFLLMVTSSTLLSAFGGFIEQYLELPRVIPRLLDIGVSFVFLTSMFAILFKLLPERDLRWREVAGGAAVTSSLFVLSKSLIGLYLGITTTGSVFGAAGALAILLMWFYLSAQIFFFGATLTHVWVKRYGSGAE